MANMGGATGQDTDNALILYDLFSKIPYYSYIHKLV